MKYLLLTLLLVSCNNNRTKSTLTDMINEVNKSKTQCAKYEMIFQGVFVGNYRLCRIK